MWPRLLVCLLVAGCGAGQPASEEAPFREYVVATPPGMSGLRADAAGSLWAVPERERSVLRLEVTDRATIADRLPIVGVPEDLELEEVALLGDGRFVFGAEGHTTPAAALVIARREGAQVTVTGVLDLPAPALGLPLLRNEGAEGVCVAGDTVYVAIESSARRDGRRWSPIVRIERGAITHVQTLWLTTRTGTISSLDCRRRGDVVEAIAVERNLGETRILTFPLSDQPAITPTVRADLGPRLHDRLNLEGITWFGDSVAAINDNQWRGIHGPTEVVVFTSCRRCADRGP